MINNIKMGCLTPIIPTVYGNSLSYMEQVCILTNKMNEIINVLNDKFDTLLVEYIENRFNDIMVQTMYNSETKSITFSMIHSNSEGGV